MDSPVSYKVFAQIKEKTDSSTGMFVQEIYKETLRNLISVFGQAYYLDRNNNPVKVNCFHANQERAVAKKFIGNNITLPVITIEEVNSSNSDERRRYNQVLVHESYWDKDKNRSVRILSMTPRPVDISYSINIWSKYKNDLDQIREYIFNLFNPELVIDLPNQVNSKSFIISEGRTVQSEADDGQDRILKKSIEIQVQTYIPSPKFLYTSTGMIETLNTELIIDNKLNTPN